MLIPTGFTMPNSSLNTIQKYKTSEKRLLVGPILVVPQFDLATSFSKKRSTITTGGLS